MVPKPRLAGGPAGGVRVLALLRLCGLPVPKCAWSVAWESLVTCAVGAVEGVVVGVVSGWAFVRVLRDRGLRHFSIPIGTVVVVLVASLVIGMIVSILPARRAARP